MLVAVILAALLSAALPRFQRTAQRLQTEQGATELAHWLRLAHERAVSESRRIVWIWDEAQHRVRLALAEADEGSPQAEPVPNALRRSGRLPEELAVRLYRSDEPVECRCVTFFPGGTSEPTVLEVDSGKHVYTITVDEATSGVLLRAGAAAR